MNHDEAVVDPALRASEPILTASDEQQKQPRGSSSSDPPVVPDAAGSTDAAATNSVPLASQQGASNGGVAREGRRTNNDQGYKHQEYLINNGNPTRIDHGLGAAAPSQDDSHHEHAANGRPHASPGGVEDVKRPRACESCRSLKVRCAPDTADPEGPCARCRKAKRNCIVTVPTRKRQKKTDSRVAELEKKIDALTASLHTRTGGAVADVHQPATENTSTVNGGGWGSAAGRTPTQPCRHGYDAAQNDKNNNINNKNNSDCNKHNHNHSSGDTAGKRYNTPPCLAGHKRKQSDRDETPSRPEYCRPPPPPPPSPIRMDSKYEDFVDRGILTMEKAIELFARYNVHMTRHFPAVVFPATLSVMDLRRTKPLLFLAIMTAASGETPDLQRQLSRELMQILAEKIIVAGEKSLEIVQALHVSIIWYVPPEHFEELKFYQLVHTAAVMAIDIGLGRRRSAHCLMPLGMHLLRKSPYKRSIMPDPTTLEARRAWLGCYLLSLHVAIALQRPMLLRWTRFTAECVDLLETSPDAAPTDRYFCALVRTHRLAEDIALQLNLEDSDHTINLNEPTILFSLRKLGNDLESYFQSVPKEIVQPTLKISFGVVSLYAHEFCISPDPCHDSATSLPPPSSANAATSRPLGLPDAQVLTNAHVNLFSASLAAIETVIGTFLGMDIATIRCLPIFNFSRVAYSLVVLLRAYSAVSTPSTGLATIINKEDLRVDHYLDAVFEKIRAVAAEDQSRAASKFVMIIAMLRGYHSQRSKAGSACLFRMARMGQENETRSASSGSKDAQRNDDPNPFTPPPPPSQQQQQQQQQQSGSLGANTPLHLLSEIATNDRRCAPRPPSQSNSNDNNTNTQHLPGNNNNHNVLWGLNPRHQAPPPPSTPSFMQASGVAPNGTAATNPTITSNGDATAASSFPSNRSDGVIPGTATGTGTGTETGTGAGTGSVPFTTDPFLASFPPSQFTEHFSMEELASFLGLGFGFGGGGTSAPFTYPGDMGMVFGPDLNGSGGGNGALAGFDRDDTRFLMANMDFVQGMPLESWGSGAASSGGGGGGGGGSGTGGSGSSSSFQM